MSKRGLTEQYWEGCMLNEIIAIYAITDDMLKAIGHDEDCRRVQE